MSSEFSHLCLQVPSSHDMSLLDLLHLLRNCFGLTSNAKGLGIALGRCCTTSQTFGPCFDKFAHTAQRRSCCCNDLLARTRNEKSLLRLLYRATHMLEHTQERLLQLIFQVILS